MSNCLNIIDKVDDALAWASIDGRLIVGLHQALVSQSYSLDPFSGGKSKISMSMSMQWKRKTY